jgi:glyoxylate reductase
MIYVTRQIPDAGIAVLRDAGHEVEINPDDRPLTREELLDAVSHADAVLCLLTDKIDADVFNAAKTVKGFANYAVGYDNLDVAEATRRKIPMSNTPGVLTDATADMAWALLFAVARRVVESDAVMRSGEWGGWGPLQFIGGDITGRTLGIVGAGRIGTAMALKSRGFEMNVLYTDERTNDVLEGSLKAKRVDLDRLLAESDFVSVHVPLMDATRHLFGDAAFSSMKESAYLVNTSRGPVIDENALVTALRERKIAGAGIDVYEKEPLAAPGLAELDNVVMTPHVASATKETRDAMATMAARNILAMIDGRRPETCLNPEIFE